MKRAKTFDELKPVVAMCKAGNLFQVQDWIKAGKPINPPPPPAKGAIPSAPLDVAIELGFHSLIQVLLEGGAWATCKDGYCPLTHSLEWRRLDLVQLLVAYGAEPKSVDMIDVFRTWQPAIIDYFVEHGADLDADWPLARALCEHIRVALGTFKRHQHRYKSFSEQINIALRYHCREGNLKWASLMLWAGADPHAPGSGSPWSHDTTDDDDTALELAAFYKHPEIFDLKAIRLNPLADNAGKILCQACWGRSVDLLVRLLELGYPPNDQKNGGSSSVRHCISMINSNYGPPVSYGADRYLDTERSREYLKILSVLVQHGARWVPEHGWEINHLRRDLIKLKPDYTVELVYLMASRGGCTRATMSEVVKTPAIRSHIAAHLPRVATLLSRLPETLSPIPAGQQRLETA